MPVNQPDTLTPPMVDIPTFITALHEYTGHSGIAQDQQTCHIHYLRRKPGRGLALMYNIEVAQGIHGKSHKQDEQLISLTLDEAALSGAYISTDTSNISMQVFPADEKLPVLAECLHTAPHGLLFQALEDVARQHLCSPDWHLTAIDASSIRYKPGSRCVLHYRLMLEKEGHETRELTLYGKVYANNAQARQVHMLTQALYEEQSNQQPFITPMLPRSYRVDALPGLVLSEAVQPYDTTQVYTGTQLLRPHLREGKQDTFVVPVEELRYAAHALARLHDSRTGTSAMKLRTGKQEAQRAQGRADVLAAYYPQYADTIQQCARQLTEAMEPQEQIVPCIAHGGFKSSQLLFHSQQAFVIDFDGLCLADSALDIGYFLAYLRPSGLWYHRHGMREWFEKARHVFLSAYRQAMLESGKHEQTISARIARVPRYEAALLFKIATRRVHRLNSPRPQELLAMLDEIAQCLSVQERVS